MLNLCASHFNSIDLPINESKSHCLRIGPRARFKCDMLTLIDVKLQWVESIKYLGITILNHSSFNCGWKKNKSKFYSTLNSICSKLG